MLKAIGWFRSRNAKVPLVKQKASSHKAETQGPAAPSDRSDNPIFIVHLALAD